ncbi:non-ribosomal peptide synthetase [Lentzea aerocolonigenes]|uniref:non-ribosomal peptide synthetase n=1 Tax=Lentzea aerocolonigenes TaxID=68170 RepID=UPI0006972CBF|nr:non-ribosomal peptide synthetase [Lentzea aerocolonigenes]
MSSSMRCEPSESKRGEVGSCVAEVLGISRDDLVPDVPLTSLGLESFLAVRLRRRLRDRLGLDLPLTAFLGQASLLSLEALADGRPENEESFPLTPVQAAYWVGRDPAFPLGGVATFYYYEYDRNPVAADQETDLKRLEEAWNGLVAWHPMLRMVVGNDGRQRTGPAGRPRRFGVTDLRAADQQECDRVLAELRHRKSHQVLPPDTGPLYDVHATLLPDGRTRIHFGVDVLALDMASWLLLMRQWRVLADDPAAPLPSAPTTFGELVRRRDTDPQRREQVEQDEHYWRTRATHLPGGPGLPWTRSAEEIGVPRFTRHEVRLDRPAWARLRDRSAREGISPTALLLAAFALVLNRWGARDPFCLNATLFDRPDEPGLEHLVGDFTTTALIALPAVDPLDWPGFTDYARSVNHQFWADLDHRSVSGVEVIRAHGDRRVIDGAPPYPVVFTSGIGLGADDEPAAAWLGEEVFGVSQTPQVLLDHIVWEEGGELRVAWDAVDEALPPGHVDGMAAAYLRLLRRLADDDGAWQDRCLGWDPTFAEAEPLDRAPFGPVGELLHDPWRSVARRADGTVAVLQDGVAVTHGALMAAAGNVASHLVAHGVGPGDLVAVVCAKSADQITAVLGVSLTGAGYVPVEPSWPAARLESICARAEIRHLVTNVELQAPQGTSVHRIDEIEPGEAIPGKPRADELAYVIFTSGSTGLPKGVAVEHRMARCTVDDVVDRFGIGPHDRVLALSALSFDLSVFDVYGVLGAGGALVLPSPDRQRDPQHWLELLAAHRITVWNTAPALLEMLVDYAEADPEAAARDLRSLRLVMLSGDWIPVSLPDRLRALAPEVRFISLGGATEAAIWSICHPVEAVDPGWPSIPYGRPLRGQSFQILDEEDRPVPVGVAGELHIGGGGVARGYIGDSTQTAERFRTHPVLGQRLYRTGDLGRWRPDGTIEFLGRVDRQVKVRGHRIELGEIEAVLARQDGVRRGVVSALPGPDQRPRLVAHVVADDGWDERRTVAGLAQRLPDYMIPARFVLLDALPVTANGKVDHSALPNPYAAKPAPVARVAEEPPTDLWTAIRGEAEKRGLRLSVVVHPGELPPAQALSAAGEWARSVSGAAAQAGVVLAEGLPVDGLIELAPLPGTPAVVIAPRAPEPPAASSSAAAPDEPVPVVADAGVLEAVRKVFTELLGRTVDPDRAFFDLGATSLNLVVAHRRLRAELCETLSVVDLFAHNTVRALAEHVTGTRGPVVRAAGGRASDRRQARAMAAELAR